MILRVLMILSVLAKFTCPANTYVKARHEMRISECAAKGGECDESRGRPVCGTDDRTYPSRCHLLRVQCSGHQVSLKNRGPCRACKEAREYALKHKSKNPTIFVPRCKADGTYATVQCLGDSGCWCSDITGKPIESTSVRTGKPNCRQFKANKRRSPARQLGPGQARRVCNPVDRAAFNGNLMHVFQSEYVRSGQQQRDISKAGSATSGLVESSADKLILEWKFDQLDVNGNEILDKNEFRELKKLVKRAIKPRRCGRVFGKFCDIDDDDRLTRDEWRGCISKDGINHYATGNGHANGNDLHRNQHHQTQQHNNRPSFDNQQNPIHLNNVIHTHGNGNSNSNSNGSGNNNNNNDDNSSRNNNNNNNGNGNGNTNDKNIFHSLDDMDTNEDDESSQHLNVDYEEYDEGDDDDNLSMSDIFGSSKNFTSIYSLRPKPESTLKESESESDCLADQAAALEEQRHGGTIFYVPECTPDGRYQRVQCYRSTPYCWCVNEDTGKNIPGTSVKNQRPQCDSILPVDRPMKGCPEPRKTAFLKDLKEFLKTHVLSNTNAGANTTKWNSEDERIATLSFVILDKNKNKAWERKEWKTFRELMTNSKTLRKCGKKMPRYCDVNSDKKITLSEWLNCLQAQRNEVATTQQATQNNESVTNKRLIGSNPLEQYLKD